MYRGNNKTALRSQAWLANSLIKLMETKKYENITIKDIYINADLSRQTFYNLFNGKEDVLQFYLSTIYIPVLEWLDELENPVIDEVIERLTHTLEENRHVIRIMLDNHLELMLVDGANHVVSKLSGRLFHAEQDSTTAMYTRALISGAIVNAIIFWIEERMPVSSRELNEIILSFLEKVY